MSITAWNKIKESKGFYVVTYRRMLILIIISSSCNFILAALLYYFYFSQPEPNYYATNGVKAPLNLIAMSRPNYSPHAILRNDPIDDDAEPKVMIE